MCVYKWLPAAKQHMRAHRANLTPYDFKEQQKGYGYVCIYKQVYRTKSNACARTPVIAGASAGGSPQKCNTCARPSAFTGASASDCQPTCNTRAHAGRHVCICRLLPAEMQHVCTHAGRHRCVCRWLPAEM